MAMKKTGTCPKCGGEDVIADVKVVDRGEYGHAFEMTLARAHRPGALVGGDKPSTVSAWVCASCGFVEYYADQPALLKPHLPTD
jgi:predicted nucleic-acid-binding Zn-ribbon protein